MNRFERRIKTLQAKLPNELKMAEFKDNFKQPTQLQLTKIFNNQHGFCAICSSKLNTSIQLKADYCKENELVRGIVCINCRNGLAAFGDNPQKLRLAADYLEKFRSIHSKVKRDGQPS